jgi:uncharacterized protein
MQPLDLVRDHTIYSCVMGSRAFGLATDTSDTDRRGVFLAPTDLFWHLVPRQATFAPSRRPARTLAAPDESPRTSSTRTSARHTESTHRTPLLNGQTLPAAALEKPPIHVTGPAPEQFSWELERFCELALRANPNVLECLHSPLVEHVDDTGRELLALRGAFLSRRVYESFTRYAVGQRKKLEADLRRHGGPRWKHAMHLLRLLTTARDLLRTGVLTVDVGDERESLLAVKHGEVPWPQVEARMARLAAEGERAALATPLPPEPDRRRVADFLFRARRASALRAESAGTDGLGADTPGTIAAGTHAPGIALLQPDTHHEVVQGVVRTGLAGQR